MAVDREDYGFVFVPLVGKLFTFGSYGKYKGKRLSDW
jgi:hypothetical protein